MSGLGYNRTGLDRVVQREVNKTGSEKSNYVRERPAERFQRERPALMFNIPR
jgi:hypothetical protein